MRSGKVKILYVLNDTLKYGGTERVCLNYLSHINRDKYQIDFLLHTTEDEIGNNKICRDLLNAGTKIYCVPPRRISLYKNLKELYAFFRNNKYDVVHSHADAIGYIVLKIAKMCGHHYLIAHSHNTNFVLEGSGLKTLLHRVFLNYCRLMIRKVTKNYMACSKMAGAWLFGKKNVENGNVYILNNAIDLNKFKFNIRLRNEIRKELNIEGYKIIGHVGRFSYQKNHEFVLEVFMKIIAVDNKYKLLLIGTGENYEDIVKLVENYELSNYVRFLRNTNEVYKYYSAMDYFILPSRFEGLPVVLIEAQANGLKCLVTDNTHVTKAVKISPLVEFKKLGSADEWAKYIISNIDYDRSIDWSKKIASNGYDISIEAKKLEKYYDRILGNNKYPN